MFFCHLLKENLNYVHSFFLMYFYYFPCIVETLKKPWQFHLGHLHFPNETNQCKLFSTNCKILQSQIWIICFNHNHSFLRVFFNLLCKPFFHCPKLYFIEFDLQNENVKCNAIQEDEKKDVTAKNRYTFMANLWFLSWKFQTTNNQVSSKSSF